MKITGAVAFVAAAASAVSAAPLEGRATDNLSLNSINTGNALGNGILQGATDGLGGVASIAANALNTVTDLVKNLGGGILGGNGNRNAGTSPLAALGL